MAGGACQCHSDSGLVFMAVTLESLRQMVLVETGALAHNPGIKARVLAGARPPTGCTGMQRTRSLTLASPSKWQRLMG